MANPSYSQGEYRIINVAASIQGDTGAELDNYALAMTPHQGDTVDGLMRLLDNDVIIAVNDEVVDSSMGEQDLNLLIHTSLTVTLRVERRAVEVQCLSTTPEQQSVTGARVPNFGKITMPSDTAGLGARPRLYAIAVKRGMRQSIPAYIDVMLPTVLPPTLTYNGLDVVTIQCDTAGARVEYRITETNTGTGDTTTTSGESTDGFQASARETCLCLSCRTHQQRTSATPHAVLIIDLIVLHQ